jgi:hypothetical protein
MNCDFIFCKYNNNFKCRATSTEDCPKNNSYSVWQCIWQLKCDKCKREDCNDCKLEIKDKV